MTDTETNTELQAAKAKYPVGSRVRWLTIRGSDVDCGTVTAHSHSGLVWVVWDSDGNEDYFSHDATHVQLISAPSETTQTNPKRHKHADLIIAWVNGAEIEYKNHYDGKWYYDSAPDWEPTEEYRIKSTKPADITKDRFVELNPCLENAYNNPNVRYTFDGETKALKGVELLDNNPKL